MNSCITSNRLKQQQTTNATKGKKKKHRRLIIGHIEIASLYVCHIKRVDNDIMFIHEGYQCNAVIVMISIYYQHRSYRRKSNDRTIVRLWHMHLWMHVHHNLCSAFWIPLYQCFAFSRQESRLYYRQAARGCLWKQNEVCLKLFLADEFEFWQTYILGTLCLYIVLVSL